MILSKQLSVYFPAKITHMRTGYSSSVSHSVWCPCDEPERYCNHSNLGKTAFCGCLLGFFISQRLDAHFLCLFTHSLFMSKHSRDNFGIGEDNNEKWEKIAPKTIGPKISVGIPIIAKIISSTSSHVAFRYISVPSIERRQTPDNSCHPAENVVTNSSFLSQWFSCYSLHNNIVSVKSNKYHGSN